MHAQPFSRVHCDLMDHQDPLFMQFSRQEYWSRFPFPTPGNLPDPGIEPASHESPALAGGFFTLCLLGSPLDEAAYALTRNLTKLSYFGHTLNTIRSMQNGNIFLHLKYLSQNKNKDYPVGKKCFVF